MSFLHDFLRLVHIFTGVAWLGGSLLMHEFINPTAKTLGKDAAPFMKHLTQKTKYVPFFALVAVLNPISGLWMYIRMFEGTINLKSHAGVNLTIGGIFGLLAMINGFANIKINGDKVVAITQKIEAAGGPPSPELLTEMQVYQGKVGKGMAYGTLLLSIALIFMSLSESTYF
jgi:uncharacterized membrane protein